MGLALPYPNHRDNKKYKGGQFEDSAAQRTAGNSADQAKYRMNHQDSNVESYSLRRVKTHFHFFAWYEKQLEQ